jgi:hypothetical protein
VTTVGIDSRGLPMSAATARAMTMAATPGAQFTALAASNVRFSADNSSGKKPAMKKTTA